MTDNNHIAALADLRVGIEMDRHNLPDSDAKLAALDAALAVLRAAGEPVAWQFYQGGKWWNGDDRIKDHRKNTEEAGYAVRDLYAAPQASAEAIRNAALEEAAGMVGGTYWFAAGGDVPALIAKHIRALKSTPAAEPEWIDDPHDIEQGMMRNPKYRAPAAEDSAKGAGDVARQDYCPEKRKPGGCRLHNLLCGYPKCNEPLSTVDPSDVPQDTGNTEADRLIGRLMSSDPDFDDCADAARLIRSLVADRQQRGGDVDERAEYRSFQEWALPRHDRLVITSPLGAAHAGWQARATLAAHKPAPSDDQLIALALEVAPDATGEQVKLYGHLWVRLCRLALARYSYGLAAHKPDGGDERDAERYRFIRNRENPLERFDHSRSVNNGASCYHIVGEVRELKHGDDLDAAIDAAISAQQRQSEGKQTCA